MIHLVHVGRIIGRIARRAALEHEYRERSARGDLFCQREADEAPASDDNVYRFVLLHENTPPVLTGVGLAFFVFPDLRLAVRDLFQPSRLRPERRAIVLIDLIPVTHTRARETDQLPADQIHIAAMRWIAKHALDRVRAQQCEEPAFFHRFQFLVLLFGRQSREIFTQRPDPRTINLLRILPRLISMFWRRLDPWTFCVQRYLSCPQGPASWRSIKITTPASFAPGTERSLGNTRSHARCNRPRLTCGEEAQRHIHGAVFLRGQPERFARQRIEKHATEGLLRDRKKFAAFHIDINLARANYISVLASGHGDLLQTLIRRHMSRVELGDNEDFTSAAIFINGESRGWRKRRDFNRGIGAECREAVFSCGETIEDKTAIEPGSRVSRTVGRFGFPAERRVRANGSN